MTKLKTKKLLSVTCVTKVDYSDQISAFRCDCFPNNGGCFKANFIGKDGILRLDKMCELFTIYRKKTIDLSKADRDTYAFKLFERHCTNINEIVSPTEDIGTMLFGDQCVPCSIPASCGECCKGSCVGLKRKSPKFEMDWTIKVNRSNYLPDNKQTMDLCRQSFSFLYGLSKHSLIKISKKMKTVNSTDVFSSTTEKKYDHHSYFGDEFTLEDVQNVFDGNGIDADVQMKRGALLRYSQIFIDAEAWMEKYFYRFEYQPNSPQIHIDHNFKRDIFHEYEADMKKMECKTLSEGSFKLLWKQLFNFVKIRQVKRVSGKCWTCSYINEVRQKQKGEEVQKMIKHLMIMHRGGFFMLERMEYRMRVAEAILYYPNKTMSTIIDGASQNHCTIPHTGPNIEFSKGLDQHIEGCLTHGHGLTIYRSFPTVDPDADFTIFCLLSELEKWKERHEDQYPETWYIQIDGVSENANQYLFAALEYLVIKRMVKKILITR